MYLLRRGKNTWVLLMLKVKNHIVYIRKNTWLHLWAETVTNQEMKPTLMKQLLTTLCITMFEIGDRKPSQPINFAPETDFT